MEWEREDGLSLVMVKICIGALRWGEPIPPPPPTPPRSAVLTGEPLKTGSSAASAWYVVAASPSPGLDLLEKGGKFPPTGLVWELTEKVQVAYIFLLLKGDRIY